MVDLVTEALAVEVAAVIPMALAGGVEGLLVVATVLQQVQELLVLLTLEVARVVLTLALELLQAQMVVQA